MSMDSDMQGLTPDQRDLEALMDAAMRGFDEEVDPTQDVDTEEMSGLDILGALPDVPPRPTVWGPHQHEAEMGPPPNQPFLYIKILREEVQKSDASARAAGQAPVWLPHATPLITEDHMDIWFSDPFWHLPNWTPPYAGPWMTLNPSFDLNQWKRALSASALWPSSIEPLCREGPHGFMEATRILNDCLQRGDTEHLVDDCEQAIEVIQLEKEVGALRGPLGPSRLGPLVPILESPVADSPTLEMAPQSPEEPRDRRDDAEPEEEMSPEFPFPENVRDVPPRLVPLAAEGFPEDAPPVPKRRRRVTSKWPEDP